MKKYTKIICMVAAVCLLGTAAFCGFRIYSHYAHESEQEAVFEKIAEVVEQAQTGESKTDDVLLTEEETVLTEYGELYLQNTDMVGWLLIAGTNINYPVMQTPNNPNYYLKHSFEKEYSDLGTPYVQENCDLLTSDNLVIYGHHIKGQMSGSRAVWKEVLAVYSVKTATDPDNPQEVATMDENKKQLLSNIFWEMNEISSHTESKTETAITESDDGHGNIVQTETTVIRTYLYITVSHKTADEMADQYGFNEEQRQQLSELLAEENNSLWSAVLYGISVGDGEIVTVALSQVGNVGGQPYWSWYGFDGRVEWCACYDPYNAKEFIARWESENGPFGIEKVIQGAKTESVPLGELKKLSEERMLVFDEGLMSYAMGNCIAIEDTYGNRKLVKKRYEQTLTERYRKDIQKTADAAQANAARGGGGAGGAAEESADDETQKKLDEWYDAYIGFDKEHGTVSLYAEYVNRRNAMAALKRKTGIDLEANPGPNTPNVNIYEEVVVMF